MLMLRTVLATESAVETYLLKVLGLRFLHSFATFG